MNGKRLPAENGLEAWRASAEFWDRSMENNSNEFRRKAIRPKATALLFPAAANSEGERRPPLCFVGLSVTQKAPAQ